jgi:hypothetical protein
VDIVYIVIILSFGIIINERRDTVQYDDEAQVFLGSEFSFIFFQRSGIKVGHHRRRAPSQHNNERCFFWLLFSLPPLSRQAQGVNHS